MIQANASDAQHGVLSQTTFVTARDFPAFRDLSNELSGGVWPEFMHHDAVANEYWSQLAPTFPDFQFALLAEDSGQMMAFGNSLPIAWTGPWGELPDGGLDWALEKGFADRRAG